MPFKAGHAPKDVNRNLDRIERKITRTVVAGALFDAASVGAGISKTLTPIDTSNLINSQFIDINQALSGVTAVVGFTASYAGAVHEMPFPTEVHLRPDGNGFTWDPNGQPGFLTVAFEQNRDQIEQVFYKALKI